MASKDARKGEVAFIVAVAAGHTVRAAAKRAGIGERSAHRRASEPSFRKRVQELRQDMLQRAAAILADSSTEASRALRKLLNATSEQVRLGAARTTLELAFHARREVEIEARLVEIETQIAKTQEGPSCPDLTDD